MNPSSLVSKQVQFLSSPPGGKYNEEHKNSTLGALVNIPQRLLYNRSDPEVRAKLVDYMREESLGRVALGWLYHNYNYNYNYYNNNYNYNYNYYNYNYNYYNNNYNNYYNYNNNNNCYNQPPKGFNMKPGLKAVAIPFGYSITWLVGDLQQVQGDEYILTGARILSLGSKTHEDVLKDGTSELSSVAVNELHRLQILRAIDLDPKVWEKLIK